MKKIMGNISLWEKTFSGKKVLSGFVVGIFSLVSLFSATQNVLAVPSPCKTWTGTTNNRWANNNNWSPSGVPSGSDCVIIPNVSTQPRITTDITGGYSGDTTIDSGATLTLAASGTGVFAPSGDMTVNGTFTQIAGTSFSPSGSITVNGTATITSDITIAVGKTFTMNAGSEVNSSGNTFVNGTFTQNGGVYTAAGGTETIQINATGVGNQHGGTIYVRRFRVEQSGASFTQDESSGSSLIKVGRTFGCKAGTTFTSNAGIVERVGDAVGGTDFDVLNGACSFHILQIDNINGILRLDTDTATAQYLKLGQTYYKSAGTWGSTASSATNVDDTYFNSAYTGLITVLTGGYPTLAEAQAAAHADLNSALAGYNEDDYSSENWTALNNAKTDGDTAIDNATDILGVTSARDDALDAMDDVKTLAETYPEASVTSPTASSVLDGTVTITADVSAVNGVQKVEFWYASIGTLIGEGTNTNPGEYSIDWDTTTVLDGSHDLFVRVYDNLDNMTQSDSVSVTVDNLSVAVAAVEAAETSQTQEDVDSAQALVSALPDGEDKSDLQDRLDAVQDIIDARTQLNEATAAVELAEGTKKQSDVDAAQALVSALPDGEDKSDLQDRLDAVQTAIDTKTKLGTATAAVELAEGTKMQSDVDVAKASVSALPDGSDKTALQNRLNAVQAIIDAAKAGQPVNEGPTPEKFQTDVIAGFISVTGTPTAATAVSFDVDYTINAGNDKVVLPAGTVMTKTGGGALKFTEMDFDDIADALKNASVGEIAGAVSLGIPGLNLSFSKPISITINVGSTYNGQTLNVYFQNEGQADWTGGLSCVVADGLCTFQTDHATDYSAGDDPGDTTRDDEDENTAEKAKISSWEIEKYYDLTKDQNLRVKIEIKGKHFAKKAEVRIGGKKADRVERKSSKKIVAWFDWKDLNGKYDRDRKLTVKNPGADAAKSSKSVDIREIGWNLGSSEFDSKSTEGIRNIQRALFNMEYLSEENITGLYGPKTVAAVKKFQADNGIPETGNVGPLTREMLTKKVK